jgi:DNA-binding NarL/FixJ family response regulator
MSLKVLIVDDNAVIRGLLRTSIEQNTEWSVCGEAENGRMAIDLVRESPPHAVILDLQMPVMNGFDAARQISSIAPTTTIAMLTSYEHEEVLKEAHTVGIQRVFSKSEKLALLIDWLRNIEGEQLLCGADSSRRKKAS